MMMVHYANVSASTRNGKEFNLARATLAKEHIATLDMIMDVSTFTGLSPAEVIAERFHPDLLGKVNYEATLPDGPMAFTRDALPKRFGDYAVTQLTPIVDHLARTGWSAAEIKAHLDTHASDWFVDSEFVVDLNVPLGETFRTDRAPELILRDEDELAEMVRQVQEVIPGGYYFGRQGGGAFASHVFEGSDQGHIRRIARGMAGREAEREGLRPVYMVPNKQAGRGLGRMGSLHHGRVRPADPTHLRAALGRIQ